MTVSLPIGRRATKCLVPGASAIYLFNEGTGTTLRDHSGNGYDGTLGVAGAAPTWDTTGLVFGADDYVALPAITTPLLTLSFVFGLAADIGPATADRVISGHSATTDIHFGGYTGLLTNEIVSLKYDASTSRSGWCDAAGSIAAGWHTLDLVWDGTTYQMYLDGTAKTVTSVGTPAPFAGSAWKLGATSSGTVGFSDSIGIAAAYPVALTPTQLAQNRSVWSGIMAARGETLV